MMMVVERDTEHTNKIKVINFLNPWGFLCLKKRPQLLSSNTDMHNHPLKTFQMQNYLIIIIIIIIITIIII